MWQTTQFPAAAKNSFLSLRKDSPRAGEYGRGVLVGGSADIAAPAIAVGGTTSGVNGTALGTIAGASGLEVLQAPVSNVRPRNMITRGDFRDMNLFLHVMYISLASIQ